MRGRPRRGFTLIEAILGLALGGIVLLNARLLVNSVESTRGQFQRTVVEQDRWSNGLRLARRLLANADPGVDSTERLAGTGSRMEVQSWCEIPTGSWRRCRAVLWTSKGASTTTLFVKDAVSDSVFVATLVGDANLAYLSRDSREDRWLPTWGGREDFPLALSFGSLRDTVTFALGAR